LPITSETLQKTFKNSPKIVATLEEGYPINLSTMPWKNLNSKVKL
jgi:hypothetical protein